MSIAHFNDASDDEDFEAKIITSSFYKTSLLYGDKKILLSVEVHRQLGVFIEYFRPLLIQDGQKKDTDRPVFTSSTPSEKAPHMKHSLISAALTSAFKRAGILKRKRYRKRSHIFQTKKIFKLKVNTTCFFHSYTRVSCTKIRHSIATELAGYKGEKLEVLARQFMKNKPSTCAKYYVQNWKQREASRLSWECYGTFQLEAAQPVTKNEVKSWLHQQQQRIEKDFDVNLDDQKLLEMVEMEDDGYTSDHGRQILLKHCALLNLTRI